MSKISLMPLGGQDERGKNCFVIEIDDSIFVFDAGIKVPINGKLGVSMITPDFEYLSKNSSRIKGIFIGYPYSNNYAGLPFLLQKINVKTPVYCSKIGKIVIDTYYEKTTLKFPKPNVISVDEYQKIEFNDVTIIPFKICNSILDSLGWIIKTPDGSIIYVDDFMVNNDKTNIFEDHIEKINSITRGNNLALIPAVGNVGNFKSFTTPNHKNYDYYDSIISNTNGRVFVAINDQDAYTVINLANIAKAKKRPFCVYGSTFMNVFSGAIKNHMINTKGLVCLKISEIANSPNVIVVISAMQDNLFKLLFNIVSGGNNSIKLDSKDTFVLGTQLINGYEGHGARLMDELNRLDVNAHTIPRTILPMSASNEDHKHIIDLLSPKYIFPIQGYYKYMVKYEFVVAQTKIKLDHVYYLDNGEKIQINNGDINENKEIIKLSDNYIGNVGSIDVGTAVISERKQLAEAGIIFITIALDSSVDKILNFFQIDTYGALTNDNNSKILLEEVISQFKENITECIVFEKNKKKIDNKETKILLKKIFTKMFEKKFNKRPIVLPSIIEINNKV